MFAIFHLIKLNQFNFVLIKNVLIPHLHTNYSIDEEQHYDEQSNVRQCLEG